MAANPDRADVSLHPIAVLINELKNEDIQVIEKGHFLNSSKPKGTDDDFKSAACAGSLVTVPQKFVGGTGNQFQKRFTVAKIQNNNDDHAVPIPKEKDNLITDPKLMQRRNSRSLSAKNNAQVSTTIKSVFYYHGARQCTKNIMVFN
uniref:CSON014072 protein n=1 Tax=Culicoides sonorensis TaxID=179676 RepID=A0A336MAF0_CULSO